MSINDALERFCAELRAGGYPHPLDQPVPVGLLWLDLCALAGEEPSSDGVSLVDAPVELPAPEAG